ncbi:hypothetical protein Agub_g192 [Astrephomene gubernaculifera]|uniref:Right handed beta helix domain-containing protein n=1 Tax=Astrephomene gubernaculifera TaxID=47775 RepID=A0AAD3HG92_9CHLO|nr:hypothetical protein Agub_g192 [Astrephomene gubernaculifera]
MLGPLGRMLNIGFLVVVLGSAFCSASKAFAEERARRVLTETVKTYDVIDELDLINKAASAALDGYHRVVFLLPPTTLVLNTPLNLTIDVTIQGAASAGDGLVSVLRCGSASMANLIEFSGSSILLSGVQLQDCVCPGLRIVSKTTANVTITDSVFHNFSRVLASGRVDLSSPGNPERVSDSTAALAIHAIEFSGSLTIRNSKFAGNSFSLPPGVPPATPPDFPPSVPPSGRRLYETDDMEDGTKPAATGATGLPGRLGSPRMGRQASGVRSLSEAVQQGRARTSVPWRRAAGATSAVLDLSWGLAAGSGFGLQRRQLAAASSTSGYSLPLLERARNAQPELEAGPWADDMEAVISVICGGRSDAGCNVRFEDVTISNNTGVATSGLYVLCDGASSCSVDMVNCTVADNKLLWQAATDENSLPQGVDIYGDGPILFRLMTPWLMYTYPLLEYYMTQAAAGGNLFGDSLLVDASQYPTVTGRTLGAVVLHQRNSPTPGSEPSSPAMMKVQITGGSFYGNDGSAIMSTATDFMEMAGGNGTWSGGPPRHSADFNISGISVHDHTSGWPAVWLRWARNANIEDCEMTGSTGAIWLDEIRDTASIVGSSFIGNELTQLWLDYISFMTAALNEGISYGTTVGAGISHTVKVQMTALGDVENTAIIKNCRFEDNSAYITGVLFIRASDSQLVEKNSQPGITQVQVVGTNFTANKCRRSPEICLTAERPLSFAYVYNASVESCRFTGNLNGGVYLDTVHGSVIDSSTFEGNIITYQGSDGEGSDTGYGGAGIIANYVGLGGVNITSSDFINNVAAVGGGAVFLRYFDGAQINGCSFEGNKAQTYDGGALWMEVSSISGNELPAVYIYGSTFSNNSAGRNGGAISGDTITSSTPWTVEECTFTDNVALLSPDVERGPRMQDRAGGGAIYAANTDLHMTKSELTGNKVLGYAGGAVRMVDSSKLQLTTCTFKNNVAIMGGAVAVTRTSQPSAWSDCTFVNNTVVDPWAWPDTTPVEDLRARSLPSLSFIDPGFGGAAYAFSAAIYMMTTGSFVGNSAKLGGAMAMISSPDFFIDPDSYTAYNKAPIYNYSVTPEVAEAAGMLGAGAGAVLPYRVLFANNSALIGGSLYISDVDSVVVRMNLDILVTKPAPLDQTLINQGYMYHSTFTVAFKTYIRYLYPYSAKVHNHPGVLFVNNLANGGAGVYLKGNGKVSLSNCRFAANNASSPPLLANYTGLYGRERDYAIAMAHPCYNGGGGGLCIVGQASEIIQISSSDMILNTAKDGAALYIAEGLECIEQAGCYSVALNAVNMTGNKATSRGGGIFWTHAGVLSINTCPTDYSQSFLTNGTMLGAGNSSMAGDVYSVSYKFPGRKGPSRWYGQLTSGSQKSLVSAWGGPVPSTKAGLYTVNGQLVSVAQATFTQSTPSVANPLVVVDGSVINDTSFKGIPHTYLPCANWNNKAGTGDDIATTPYFLLAPPRVGFYTSNTDIKLQVTVHDWFGQNCTGDSSTQPLVIVSVDSTEVSGALAMEAVDGSANFTSMRLRAREGLHSISMTGRVYSPSRVLLADDVEIYVRPCAINEFLSPKNLDECIVCDVGSYNFNVSAVTCAPCPDNADCGYPNPTACQKESCDPVGFMVPQDGYWHVNFFSNQVLECPNPNSCMSENRSTTLARIQQEIWQLARNIQLNTSNAVADAAAQKHIADMVDSQLGLGLRRLLQQKAISDEEDYARVLEATVGMLSDYQQHQCATGYTGTLCGQCAPGYGWRKIATCVKCPPKALNNLYYLLVTILTLTMLVITVYSSLREQKKPGKLVGGVDPKDSKKKDKQKKDKHAKTTSNLPPAAHSGPVAPPTCALRLASGSMPAEAMAVVSFHNASVTAPQGANGSLTNNGSYYEDPAVAAARGAFGSAPATPKGLHVSLPPRDPSAQSPVVSINGGAPCSPPNGHVVMANGGSLSGAVAEGTELADDGYEAWGPLGEGAEHVNMAFEGGVPLGEGVDYNNVLYEEGLDRNAGRTAAEQIQPAEGFPASERSARSYTRRSVPLILQQIQPLEDTPPQAPRMQPPTAPVQPPGSNHHPMGAGDASHIFGPRPRQFAMPSTIVKILVSYVQVLALLQNVPLDIPGVVDIYYRINNQAISYPGMLVSLDCSLPNEGNLSKAIVRVTLTALAPLYIFAGAIIFFLVYNVLDYFYLIELRAKHATKKRKKVKGPLRAPTFKQHMEDYLGRQLIVTFITIFFFFYPSVVQSLMTIFNCTDVNSASEPDTQLAAGLGTMTDSVWSQDFGLVCYKGTHLGLAMGLGVPGVLLIAIGWPIVSGLLVTQRLPCITNILLTEEMTDFFLADFKPEYVWWESLVMLRKLAIAVIVTLVEANTSAGVQLLLVFIILVIAMAAHLYAQPYRHSYTNFLESMSLVVLLFTLYFSLFFSFSNDISSGGRIAISIIILVLNIVMVLTLVRYVLRAYWSVALDNTGLAKLDAATRRRLTPAEIQQRILENMAASQGSVTARQMDARPSYGARMAGLYAAAFWASMRVNSTTSRVMTRVRTLLDAPPPMDPDNPDAETGPNLERNSAPGRLASVTAAGRPPHMSMSALPSRNSSFVSHSNTTTTHGAEISAAAAAAAAANGGGFVPARPAAPAQSASAREPLGVGRTPSQSSNPRLPPYPVALDPEAKAAGKPAVMLTSSASAGPRLGTQAPPRVQSRLSAVATARPNGSIELTPPPHAESE